MVMFVEMFVALMTFLNQGTLSNASCYFQQEFQGEFIMQSSVTMGTGIQYATLNITPTSIPIWGNCHRRIGNNFILMINYAETSCIRCLHLKLQSPNVLQVIAASHTISKCSTTEESAQENCPSEDATANKNTSEILLFKTKDALGSPTNKEYCPIDGKYLVNYKGKSAHRQNECAGLDSTMDTCPSGSILNFRLKGCSIENHDLNFECLGHWTGPRKEKFLVFIDNRHINGLKPKYRCSIYKEDEKTGKISMTLSKDSTCITEFGDTSNDYETLVLTPKEEKNWPLEVSFGMSTFPKWMQGNWEHVRVDGDKLVYKDHTSLKTYTIKCAGVLEGEHKYLIYSRTQCDEEYYSCMKITKRSNNILEFQLGTNYSQTNNVFDLCPDANFLEDSWITQGRVDASPDMSTGICPIAGEYTGVIPDASDLCAKLWSDCRAPELMYYQVSHCETGEVYEEREYKCLGHWREADLLYTYTQRQDVAAGTYECFVGTIVSSEEIFIKEAGEHCQRHIDPHRDGMKLIKKGLYSCISKMQTTPHYHSGIKTTTTSTNEELTPTTIVAHTKSTRKPWNFENDVTHTKSEKTNGAVHMQILVFPYILTFMIRLLL